MMLQVLMAFELARVWQAQGDVYIVRAEHVMKARKGQALKVGDIVRVGKRSLARIKYYDGSYVKIAPNTVLKIKDEKGVYLSKGRVFSKVRKILGKKGFYVSTQTAVAGVRGTEFEVKIEGDSGVEIAVYKGKVEVVNLKSMKKELLERGKALKVSLKGEMKELKIDVRELRDEWKEVEKEAKSYQKEIEKMKMELKKGSLNKEEIKSQMEEVKSAGEEIKEELAEARKEAKELEAELSEYREAIEDAMEEMRESAGLEFEEQEGMEGSPEYEEGQFPGGWPGNGTWGGGGD